MSENITVSVPADDTKALIYAGELFLRRAGVDFTVVHPDKQDQSVGAVPELSAGYTEVETSAQATVTLPPAAKRAPIEVKNPDGVTPQVFGETAAGPAQLSGVELDDSGLPWDGRIHSRGKTKEKNGNWRKKKKVDADYYAAIEKELRAAMAVGAPPIAYGQQQTPSAIPQPPAPAIPTPPSVASQVPQPPVAQPAPTNYAEFLAAMNVLIGENRATMQTIMDGLAKYSVNIQTLASREDLIPAVWQDLTANG